MPDISPSPLSNIQINVTQKHIDDGTPQSCRFCPIALAINEQLREPFFVQVGETLAKIYKKLVASTTNDYFGCYGIYLPPEATRFIRHFDNKFEPVEPFTFQLEIPAEYLKNVS